MKKNIFTGLSGSSLFLPALTVFTYVVIMFVSNYEQAFEEPPNLLLAIYLVLPVSLFTIIVSNLIIKLTQSRHRLLIYGMVIIITYSIILYITSLNKL